MKYTVKLIQFGEEKKKLWNNSNILSRNTWTGLAPITRANEIANKASLSGGYKWPLIRDEPSVFIERDL